MRKTAYSAYVFVGAEARTTPFRLGPASSCFSRLAWYGFARPMAGRRGSPRICMTASLPRPVFDLPAIYAVVGERGDDPACLLARQ